MLHVFLKKEREQFSQNLNIEKLDAGRLELW